MAKKSKFSVEFLGNMSPDYMAGYRDVFISLKYLPQVIYKNESRYKNFRTLKDLKRNKIHHESALRYYIPQTDADEFYTVTEGDAGRLDIISMNVYGTPRYWWAIAASNDIKDPFDVELGITLRIPSKHALYMAGGVLSG